MSNNPLILHECENCYDKTLTPIFKEVEVNYGSNNDYPAEVDAMVIRCFCSQECIDEYES